MPNGSFSAAKSRGSGNISGRLRRSKQCRCLRQVRRVPGRRWIESSATGMAQNWQQPLPPIYTKLSDPELRLRIQSAKDALGAKLVILGHHYQQDDVTDFADFTGDSFELSRRAA